MGFVKRLWRDQAGVVESTLVMIPLLVLFLITAELIIAVNLRNIDQNFAQSDASVQAISGATSGEVISLPAPDSYGKLRIVVTHRSSSLPWLLTGIPLLGTERPAGTDVNGLAVVENLP